MMPVRPPVLTYWPLCLHDSTTTSGLTKYRVRPAETVLLREIFRRT